MEMNLPPSGLANIAYPDVFPTPPNPSDEIEISDDQSLARSEHRRESFSLRPSELDLEMIWSYYLSELAVRKIANRIMNCFYRQGESSWLSMPIDRMIRVAEELELQISQWCVNWPASLPEVTDLLVGSITSQMRLRCWTRLKFATSLLLKSCNLFSMLDFQILESEFTVHFSTLPSRTPRMN